MVIHSNFSLPLLSFSLLSPRKSGSTRFSSSPNSAAAQCCLAETKGFCCVILPMPSRRLRLQTEDINLGRVQLPRGLEAFVEISSEEKENLVRMCSMSCRPKRRPRRQKQSRRRNFSSSWVEHEAHQRGYHPVSIVSELYTK